MNAAQMLASRPCFIDTQVRIRDMDRVGIDVQAIAIAPPQHCHWTDPELPGRTTRVAGERRR